ncbi:RdgB/HAM1 family non-canonical purine NTP pyrophosphatase [Limisalsivibrio acetivorans]|uniref:RdgB/HAM1 family non-canonical purine NTP pyrophosphatase n=1 Tax=Limisalsivibrio acetivorans TaxID=1304888 RepID=UPI0003B48D40|nr:RdgB/HAM1 family non-canonical purine NTP pyrophosphatase [Limisalsivibrio acetivorans]
MRIYVATKNMHKLEEIQKILEGNEVYSAYDYIDGDLDVEETGSTYEENASIKAAALSKLINDAHVIADDSGLSVEAMEGAPGVYSARFAGENATDAQNNDKLLRVMKDVPDEMRDAAFVCAIALAKNGEVLKTFRGECPGRLAHEPKGGNGFGYDPLVITPDGRSMAELSPAEKNSISHRGKALRKLRDHLAGQV